MLPVHQKFPSNPDIAREKLDISKEKLNSLSLKQSNYELAMARMAEKITLFDNATTTRVYDRAMEAYNHDPGPAKYPCHLPTDPALRDVYNAQVDGILNNAPQISTLFE
jgi:hypothetical protein